MSTTRFWDELDDRCEVRRAEGRPLYGMRGNILGWIMGKWMVGEFKVEVTQKLQYLSQVMG